tara:strand:+ start:43762 stop:51171 length:7410 start_codon:yes stop_codon:yes gene_type:complete
MADLTASLFPLEKSPPDCDDGAVVNCTSQASGLPEEVEGGILYPTSDEIETIGEPSESPIPLFGGSILKLPAPSGVEFGEEKSSETNEKIMRLIGKFSKFEEVMGEVPEDIVRLSSEDQNINIEESIYKAKMALNNGLFEIAKSGRTSEIKNVCKLYITESLYSDLSSDSPDSRGNRIVEFVYIPVDILNYITSKFGEKFGEICGITGTTYETFGTSATSQAKILKLQKLDEGESTDAAVEIDAFGFDVIGLILSYLGVYNMCRPPMTLEDLPCLAPGGAEICDEAEKKLAELEAKLMDLGLKTEGMSSEDLRNSLYTYLDDLDDSMMREILLEFFPIYNMSEKQVADGRDRPRKAAFFTIYDDNIYLKMPDLSCMDSAGFIKDSYIDTNGEKYRFLYFEYVLNGEILRFGFDYQAPPSASMDESYFDYPESSEIKLELTGYLNNVAAIYLSPVVGLSADTDVSGFNEEVEDEIELFSFPPVSMPVLRGSGSESMYSYPDRISPVSASIQEAMSSPSDGLNLSSLFEASIESDKLTLSPQDSGGMGLLSAASDAMALAGELRDSAELLEWEVLEAEAEGGEVSEDLTARRDSAVSEHGVSEGLSDVASAAAEASKTKIDLGKLGFPLSVKPKTIESLSRLVGDMNRPELMLSDVNGDPEDNIEAGGVSKNNTRLYSSKFHHSSPLRMCHRPRLYNRNDLPVGIWVASSEFDFDEDEGKIEVEFNSDGFKFFKTKNLKFAVYVADNLGQITRVPDKYLVVEGAIPAISSVSPNGFDNNPVVTTDKIDFSIEGTGLAGVDTVIATPKDGGPSIEISSSEHGSGSIFNFTATDERLDISANPEFTKTYSSKLFKPETEYSLSVKSGIESSDDDVLFAMSSPGTFPGPPFPGESIKLKYNTISARSFSSKCIEGMPVLQNGKNVFVKLKASKPVFDSSKKLYAYLAFPKDAENISGIMDEFSFEDQRYNVNVKTPDNKDAVQELIVPSNIFWEFGNSDFKNDATAFFSPNKKAIFAFPGKDYQEYNFSSLLNLEKCYILFLANDIIDDLPLTPGTAGNLADTTYSVVQIGIPDGKNPRPAFVSLPHIVGMFAKISPTEYQKTVPEVSNAAEKRIKEIFDVDGIDSFKYSSIKAADSISKIAIIFKAVKHATWPKKFFKFYIGANEIPTSCVVSVSRYTGNNKNDEIIAVLKDVLVSEEGDHQIYVSRKDSKFLQEAFGLTTAYEYTSEYLYKQVTTSDITITEEAIIPSGIISDDDTDTLIIKTFDSNSWSGPPLPGVVDTTPQDRIPHGSRLFTEIGLPIDKTSVFYREELKTRHDLMRPIEIVPTHDFSLDMGFDGVHSAHLKEEGIEYINLDNLSIPVNTEFTTQDYFFNKDENKAKAFFRLAISNHSAGAFNKLEIISLVQNSTVMSVESGSTATAPIQAAKSIIINVTPAAPAKVAQVKMNGFEARVAQVVEVGEVASLHVVIPAAVAQQIEEGESPCVEICVTTDNKEVVQARRSLGFDRSNNPGATGIGLPGGLKPPDCCDVHPLNFTSIKLPFPIIPPHLARSICDFSWHLTAELQLHLNNFKVLLIPIQVLLCIIDVICAMLNPWKMVLAIIRLFMCLYDLLLLLPQLSVPIMFLNLLLHLLDIIICIIEKILMVIKTINALVNAIKAAVEEKSWKSIIILEEAISEHFLEINTDLDILGPIIQILALFLELLQLVFRFPCQINSGAIDGFICGIDGTLLAGMIKGKAVSGGVVDNNYVLPVAQAYPRTFDGNMWHQGLGGDCALMADILSYITSGVSLDNQEPYNPSGPTNSGSSYSSTADFNNTKISLHEDGTFLSSMSFEDGSGLANESGDFRGSGDAAISFVTSCSKSKKGIGGGIGGAIFGGTNVQKVRFDFSSRAEPFCVDLIPVIPLNAISISKYCDTEGPADYPFVLFDPDSYSDGTLSLAKSGVFSGPGGTFVSPIDGYQFLYEDGSGEIKAKDLEVTFEWTDWELTPEGEVIEVEKSEVKTFDGVPSVVIMDEAGDVYFIDKISFNDDGAVESIEATVINQESASKLKTTKEEMDISRPGCSNLFLTGDPSGGGDGSPPTLPSSGATTITCDMLTDLEHEHHQEAAAEQDAYLAVLAASEKDPEWQADKDPVHATKNVFNFPKLYFVDLRQFQPELQEMCTGPSINDIMMETEDPTDIIQDTKDCLEEWISKTKQQGQDVIDSLKNGEVPEGIDLSVYTANTQELLDCLGVALGDICKIAISTLTTSFKVLEDDIEEPLAEFVSPDAVDTELIPDFLEEEFAGPSITGAQEYAAGIGDSATVTVGQEATIVITPRDIYDEEIATDLSEKIIIEIISDSTATARLQSYTTESGLSTNVQKIEDEYSYEAKLTASEPGIVKLRAKICDRTIQALSYTALQNDLTDTELLSGTEVDCVEDAEVESEVDTTTNNFNLTKVDRILTIIFTKDITTAKKSEDSALLPKTVPQAFGTKLEN